MIPTSFPCPTCDAEINVRCTSGRPHRARLALCGPVPARGRPASPALDIACPTCHKPAGEHCKPNRRCCSARIKAAA